MSAVTPLVIGGLPRVDLLPPEVHAARKRRRDRWIAIASFGVVVVVTLMAVGGAFVVSVGAEVSLAAEQNKTGDLLLEQASLSDIRLLHDSLDLTQTALQVSAATDVDWVALAQGVLAVLPPELAPQSMSAQNTSPFTPPTTSGPIVTPTTTIVFELTTPEAYGNDGATRLDVAGVLDRVADIDGVAHVGATPFSWDSSADRYSVAITVAFDGVTTDRFAAQGE